MSELEKNNKVLSENEQDGLESLAQEEAVEEVKLDENSLIEFTQELEKDDLFYYNSYIISRKVSTWIFRVMIGIFAIVMLVVSIIELNYIYMVISVLFLLYVLFVPYFQKKLLKRAIEKRTSEAIKVVVKVADNGFVYRTPEEKDVVLGWQYVVKAVSYPNYIYMHIRPYHIVILKKNACDNFLAIENLIEEQLGTGARFFVKEK